MSDYIANGGKALTITPENIEKVTSIQANDGTINIVNSSDSGMVVEFEKSAVISIKSFGQVNVRGKMITIGSSDGTIEQVIPHWQSVHPINVIWVEDAPETNRFSPWFGINPQGSDLAGFEAFSTEIEGRVFKWQDGDIIFSDSESYSQIPADGCKIQVPNIIFSTEDPFSSTKYARLRNDEGGSLNISGVSFSDFGGTFRGLSHLDIRDTGFYGSTYIQYGLKLKLSNVFSGMRDSLSSGLNINYSSDILVSDVGGISFKNNGLSITHSKEINGYRLLGITVKRDSANDSPVSLKTVQNLKVIGIVASGGQFRLENTAKVRVYEIRLSDQVSGEENSSTATSNIVIDNASETSLHHVSVVKEGGAKLSYASIRNSSDIDITKMSVRSSYANNVMTGDVSSNLRISELYYDGFSGATPFFFPRKNNGLLLQSVSSKVTPDIKIEAINTVIKGVQANQIITDIDGIANCSFAQIYTGESEGKLVSIMTKGSASFSNILGRLKWSNDAKMYFDQEGDSIEIEMPFNVKGVTLQDIEPEIDGSNIDALAIDYSLHSEEGWSSFKGFHSEHLQNEVIDTNKGFRLKFRITAGSIEKSTCISTITLNTYDKRTVYPLDTVSGILSFEENAVIDDHAKYFLFFKQGYGTPNAVLVKDANGLDIQGHVDGRSEIRFEYDFANDNTNGREPGFDVEMVLVLAGSSIASSQTVSQEFRDGIINMFRMRASRDNAYKGE